MPHGVAALLQDHLHGLPGLVVNDHRTAQVHRAVRNRVAHHAQGIEAQLLAALHSQLPKLLPREDGGVVWLQGEGVHRNEGQLGRPRALEAQQAPPAPLEGHEAELLLLLKAEEPFLEPEQMLAVRLAEIFGLQQHV